MNFLLGSADYLEITVPPDLRKEQSGKTNERKEAGEFSEASGSTIPQAVVLPAEIPCEVSIKTPCYFCNGYCMSLKCN